MIWPGSFGGLVAKDAADATSGATDLEASVRAWADSLGFVLVKLLIAKTPGRGITLQVFAERPDGTMKIDDCAELSRGLTAKIEAAEHLNGQYALEISSPGVDRPLNSIADFERYVARTVRLETTTPVGVSSKDGVDAEDGRRRLCGVIESVTDGVVRLLVDKAVYNIPYSNIAKAKLEVTEALFGPGKSNKLARRGAKRGPKPETTDAAAKAERQKRSE